MFIYDRGRSDFSPLKNIIYSAHVRLRQQNFARAMAFSPYYIQLNNVLKLYSVVYS
jgi:hypothetical protein